MRQLPSALSYAFAGALALCLSMVARLRLRNRANLRFQLRHDGLTGLPNRLALEESPAKALAAARFRKKRGLAVMFIALDGASQVNDFYGQLAADAVRKQVAARIKRVLRRPDLLACVGDDEFAVVLKMTRDAGAREQIGAIAERILAVVRGCSGAPSHHVSVTASIGISQFPEHAHEVTALLRLADLALRKVRSLTSEAVGFYDPSRISEIVALIRAAIANDGLRLVFQPIMHRDGFVSQIEVLVRIHDFLLGIIPPDEFIGVAEQTGLIHEMGAWVLRDACRQARAWRAAGYSVPIAVNVSPVQLEAPGFALHVRACLAEAGLTAQALVLEVTENALIESAAGHNTARAGSALRYLQAAGVSISLDYSGAMDISKITTRMPVDSIKIDRFLTAQLPANRKMLEIVSRTVEWARTMGYRVIMEGIEETPQLDLARAMGSDLLQGFLIAPPLQPEDAAEFLAGHFVPSVAVDLNAR